MSKQDKTFLETLAELRKLRSMFTASSGKYGRPSKVASGRFVAGNIGFGDGLSVEKRSAQTGELISGYKQRGRKQ